MLRNNTSDLKMNQLLSQIEGSVQFYVNNKLNETTIRLNTLEHTHSVIMGLPSVVDEFNIKTVLSNVPSDNSPSQNSETSALENKLDAMDKKNEALLKILDKVLIDIQSLNQDIKCLKESSLRRDKGECLKTTIQPSIVLSCKNENIQFDMKEDENIKDMSSDAVETGVNLENNKVELEEKEIKIIKFTSNTNITQQKIDEVEEEAVSEEVSEEEVSEEEVSEEEEEEEVSEEEEEEVSEEEEEETEEEESEEEEEEVKPTSDENITQTEDDVETEAEASDEEEEELVEIEIDDITYCTNDEENGVIYELTPDGEVGEKVGYLKEGEPFFYADEK